MEPDYKAAWEAMESAIKDAEREAVKPPHNSAFTMVVVMLSALKDSVARKHGIPPKSRTEPQG